MIIKSKFLIPIFASISLFLFFFLFYNINDPLDQFPWGKSPNLKEIYSTEGNKYLVNIISKKNIKNLILSGSTARNLNIETFRNIYPEKENIFKISYSAPRPKDFNLIFKKIKKNKSIENFYIFFDWIFSLKEFQSNPGFPYWLYNDNVWDKIKSPSLMEMHLAFLNLLDRPLDHPDWNFEKDLKNSEIKRKKFEKTNDKLLIGSVSLNVVLKQNQKSCSDFKPLNQILNKFLQDIDYKKNIYLIIPPFHISAYFNWYKSSNRIDLIENFFNDLMLSRKCLLKNIEGKKNIKIFAFDNIPWIINDKSFFHNSLHVYNSDIFSYMFTSIKKGENQISLDKFNDYKKSLVKQIKEYNDRYR